MDLLAHLPTWQGSLHSSRDLLQSLLSFWVPLKTSSFFGHSVNEPEQHTQTRNVLPPKSKEASSELLGFGPLPWLQEGPDTTICPSP